MTILDNPAALDAAVAKAVAEVKVVDVHTHLFPPSHGAMMLWGADEVLTYHYLVAELFAVAPAELTPAAFWQLPKRQQADLVWEHVFLRHGALSEAARGAITVFNALGLDVAGRDLAGIRKWFAAQTADGYLAKVLDLAGVDYAVMTNNPFVQEEVDYWRAELPVPACLKTALRIDTLLLDWPTAGRMMKAQGYRAGATPDARSLTAARKFLVDWARRIKPVYLAASLPDSFAYPARNATTRIMDGVVLPAARELGLPVAMMIGVRRGVNPLLRDGGDGVGVCDLRAVQSLCAGHGDVKFLVTVLSRVNQHELCVLARKFGNLHAFGCWWFCNNPSIIAEMTAMRVEMLGTAFTSQHSDARVLDQLVYKWHHSRQVIGRVLAGKFRDLLAAGWRPTEDEVRREVRAILGGSFEAFCGKQANRHEGVTR